MFFPFKKLFFSLSYNFLLFSILIIGMQNSSDKQKVYLISAESVPLPISFIIGLSFISGSFIGCFMNLNNLRNKDNTL